MTKGIVPESTIIMPFSEGDEQPMTACGGNLIGCEISRNKRSAHEGTNLGRPPVAEISSEVRSTEREQAPHEAELRPLRLRRVAPIEAADLGETALLATRL